MSISPAQTRAARVWLDWTQAELATRASVGLSTVRDLEAAKREPIANNLAAIRRALESGGAEAFLTATDGLPTPTPPTGRGDSTSAIQSPAGKSGERPGIAGHGSHSKRSRRSIQAQ
jgi:transcriptional regulator with XRE-family HTH domain